MWVMLYSLCLPVFCFVVTNSVEKNLQNIIYSNEELSISNKDNLETSYQTIQV